MFFGTSTGLTTCVAWAALGGGGGGGGGGGAEATEYCATCAGEFDGNSTFQIAPTTSPTTTTTWMPTDTGSVKYFWIPNFCFLDSTTVVSNIVLACCQLQRVCANSSSRPRPFFAGRSGWHCCGSHPPGRCQLEPSADRFPSAPAGATGG